MMKTNSLFALLDSIKKMSMLLALSAFLAACASNQSADGTASTEVIEPDVITTPIDEAQSSDVDTAVALESVFYFDFDQSVLSGATRAALDAQAAALRGGNGPVRLEGHADERGSREYNLALGERRAKAVADYLAIQGVSRSRIDIVSYGEERPVALGSDESAWAQNRRVELK